MVKVFVSTSKAFTAFLKGDNSYSVMRTEDGEVMGWIRYFDIGTGRWLFDPLLTPLASFELFEIGALVADIRDAHLNQS